MGLSEPPAAVGPHAVQATEGSGDRGDCRLHRSLGGRGDRVSRGVLSRTLGPERHIRGTLGEIEMIHGLQFTVPEKC